MGILTVLMRKERVTAPELAAKYEVSRRTINRDIEDLCKAGLPIVTSQGTGGGTAVRLNPAVRVRVLKTVDYAIAFPVKS